MSVLTYPEMVVVGLLQGVSELFPVSSLGHSVLIPALIGGEWARDLNMSAKGSPYLDSLVAMHVATAAALVIFFWSDWVRIVGALFTSIRRRQIRTPDQRLAWLLVVATIPVGIAGLALEKIVREYLGRPIPVAIFLALNGLVLLTVERLQRSRAPRVDTAEVGQTGGDRGRARPETAGRPQPPRVEVGDQPTTVIPAVGAEADAETAPLQAMSPEVASDARLAKLGWGEAILIGACQILALLPGVSRSGATIAGGLMRGLRHDDAARFAFLLATPVIAAAGVLKIPDLARPEMQGAIGPTIVGSLVAGFGAYFSVKFLVKYFETRTLTPFAFYCMVVGLGCLVYFSLA